MTKPFVITPIYKALILFFGDKEYPNYFFHNMIKIGLNAKIFHINTPLVLQN